MKDDKTWILTKTIGFPPDGHRLRIGQVLTDPRVPQLPLFSERNPPPTMPGLPDEGVAKNVSLHVQADLQRCFGLWGNVSFLPASSVLETAKQADTSWEWEVEELVERSGNFDQEYVRSLVYKNSVVTEYIKSKQKTATLVWTHYPALYLVTAVRIAKGARMRMTSEKDSRAEASARITINPDQAPITNAGMLAHASRVEKDHVSFATARDFIFAYQCVQIKYHRGVAHLDRLQRGDTQSLRLIPLLNDGPGEDDDSEQWYTVDPDNFMEDREFGSGEGDVLEDEILRAENMAVILAKDY